MPRRPICLAAFVLIVVLVLTPQPAQAYIDPGTGSLILQFVAATVLGVLLGAKLFLRQIVATVSAFFKGKSDRGQPPPVPPQERGQ
ncbi:MAG: hypothetical protein LLG01_13750 [Planctomycetaceae bacterium]|nr:hypothetical protein [Planctomycetaceae bacterium]